MNAIFVARTLCTLFSFTLVPDLIIKVGIFLISKNCELAHLQKITSTNLWDSFEGIRGASEEFNSLQTLFFSLVEKCAGKIFVKLNPACGRLSGLMDSVLVSGSGLESWTLCCTLNSQSACPPWCKNGY